MDDKIAEGLQQFELYFENLPSNLATTGDHSTLCVNITDNDGTIKIIIMVSHSYYVNHCHAVAIITIVKPNITVPETTQTTKGKYCD